MSNWSDRIETAANAWKAKLTSERVSQERQVADNAADGLAQLDRAASQLEADLAAITKQIAETTTRAGALEQRAMQAIRDGDDATARETLVTLGECMETTAKLEADAGVLRALIAECRNVSPEAER